MTDPQAPPPRPLYKQNSWSPDILREETGSVGRAIGAPAVTASARADNSVSTEKDDAEVVKVRLRQWAQLVACSVRRSSSSG
ncbi:hypothetical protein M0R45_007772 [Rubus argutus]|uniref:Uncharacterized protein n=1 Tax=Rubus argutus TaxID=59490 RepID=A0AAW1XZ98_RUBAR